MLPAKALARSGLYSEKKLKTTVDDLDAWYRQHIQHDRKVSSSAMQMAFRKSDTCLPALSAHNPGEQVVVPSPLPSEGLSYSTPFELP